MSVPFKKRTLGSKKRRASHFSLKTKKLVPCEKCSKPTLPHHACQNCGTYKGKSIFDKIIKPKKQTEKKSKEKA